MKPRGTQEFKYAANPGWLCDYQRPHGPYRDVLPKFHRIQMYGSDWVGVFLCRPHLSQRIRFISVPTSLPIISDTMNLRPDGSLPISRHPHVSCFVLFWFVCFSCTSPPPTPHTNPPLPPLLSPISFSHFSPHQIHALLFQYFSEYM